MRLTTYEDLDTKNTLHYNKYLVNPPLLLSFGEVKEKPPVLALGAKMVWLEPNNPARLALNPALEQVHV